MTTKAKATERLAHTDVRLYHLQYDEISRRRSPSLSVQPTAVLLHCAIVYFTHKSPLPRLPLADIEPSGWLSLRINIEEAGRQPVSQPERGEGNGPKMGLRTIAFRLSTPSYIFSASLRISPFGTISKVFSFPFSAMSRWADNLTDLEEGMGRIQGERRGSDVKNDWMSFFSVPSPSLYVRTICRVLVIYRLPYLAVGNVM